MKRITLLTLLFIMTFSMKAQMKTGDLIFAREGKGKFSQAISASTISDEGVSYVHVGIIIVEPNGDINVLEASPERGVCLTPLEIFEKDSNGYDVKRLNFNFPVDKAIELAKSHVGEQYDWWYLPDNGKMYCSELVYESYRDYNGNPIFKAKPMNFRDSEGNLPEFWVKLYQELGQPVPEGIPGTNPNDMSRDSGLILIRVEQ